MIVDIGYLGLYKILHIAFHLSWLERTCAFVSFKFLELLEFRLQGVPISATVMWHVDLRTI